MAFDPIRAAIRFGTGLSPVLAPPGSVAEMIDRLSGPDEMALRHPIPTHAAATPDLVTLRNASRAIRLAEGPTAIARAQTTLDDLRAEVRASAGLHARRSVARMIDTGDGLRERLVRFWADHFTLRARDGFATHLVSPFVEETIRPRITGRFADLLIAVTLHPMMLTYLDQGQSMGPNSAAAQRVDRGLNENLARELLELHTVGVSGVYDQTDVRELAKLLTGLNAHPDRGMEYVPDRAEPGPETVLGVTFPDEAALSTVTAALEHLALHPATAAHLAHKIAAHFVADRPPPALVEALAARFLATGGDLLAVTTALLDHPDAWAPEPAKVKPPFDFLTSGLRALGVPGAQIVALDTQDFRRVVDRPLTVMGQPWEQPPGPDGWPEAPDDWVTPQGMAGRIDWALRAPGLLLGAELPDPRDFVGTALGPVVPEPVAFAAMAAESRADGIAVILSSPAFNRR